MDGFLKIDRDGRRYPGLILEFRDRFPDAWGSRCAFAWIKVTGLNSTHLEEIRNWKYRVKRTAFSDEQYAFWQTAKAIHDEHIADCTQYLAGATAVFAALNGRQPTEKEKGAFWRERDDEQRAVNVQKVKDQLGEIVLAPVAAAELMLHVEATPSSVWKKDPPENGK